MEETIKLCDRWRQIKGRRFDDKESTEDYRVANRNVQHGLRIDKEKWIQEHCGSMKSNLRRGNAREAFRIIKSLTKTYQPRNTMIESKDGRLLTEPEMVIERWKEYYQELYNHVSINDLGTADSLENSQNILKNH